MNLIRNLSKTPCKAFGAVLALYVLAVPPAHAQLPVPAPKAAPPQKSSPVAPPVDSDSPRASLTAFLDETRAGRWQEATRYLTLDSAQRSRGADLAKRLKGVLDLNWVDLDAISGKSAGRLDDGLPPELEEVRQISIGGRTDVARMIRTSDSEGSFWAFSPTTVAKIDGWYAEMPNRWVRDLIISAHLDPLLRPGPYELLWWQWLALPLLVLIARYAGKALDHLTRAIFQRLTRRSETGWGYRFVASIGPPLRLAWAIIVFAVGVLLMSVSPPARHFLASFTKAGMAIAFFWALWRATGVLAEWTMASPWGTLASSRNLVAVGSNLTRGAIFCMGVLGILSAFGYPFGTLLAGLGIGGLAVAFGAQKTIENIFGSVALAADQPFHVGDFVKVEDFVGTVEDIGLRSTRFRTLDRTLISIPNGKLSEQRLESFQARDRMRLAATLGVTHGTTRSQMQAVLEGFERVLRAHPKIWPDAVVVKFKEFAASSLDIEIMAWFDVPTWGDFQKCREEVLLDFMRVVEEAGTSFAFPTRTVHLVNEPAVD